MADDGILLDADHMQRALARLAHEIVERHRDVAAVVLVGIRSRGVHLAHRLAAKIAELASQELQVGSIDITLYRDDAATALPDPKIGPSDVHFEVAGRDVVLVDDVLMTGRTVRAAMDAIGLGRPRAVQVVALVDRGDREVPIKADFVGQNVERAERRRVHVHVRELDGVDEVRLQ